jgi:hypothetical protein
MRRVPTACALTLLLTACEGDGSALEGEFRCSFFFRESSEQPSFEEQVLAKFASGHGFTGLIYLTHPSDCGDYQLFCESVP